MNKHILNDAPRLAIGDDLKVLQAAYRAWQYRSTAAAMGKSEQQVTKLIYRGKQSLKTILERE